MVFVCFVVGFWLVGFCACVWFAFYFCFIGVWGRGLVCFLGFFWFGLLFFCLFGCVLVWEVFCLFLSACAFGRFLGCVCVFCCLFGFFNFVYFVLFCFNLVS